MEYTAKKNKEMPDYMHILCLFRLIEEDAYGISNTAQDKQNNTAHSDCVVIRLYRNRNCVYRCCIQDVGRCQFRYDFQ